MVGSVNNPDPQLKQRPPLPFLITGGIAVVLAGAILAFNGGAGRAAREEWQQTGDMNAYSAALEQSGMWSKATAVMVLWALILLSVGLVRYIRGRNTPVSVTVEPADDVDHYLNLLTRFGRLRREGLLTDNEFQAERLRAWRR